MCSLDEVTGGIEKWRWLLTTRRKNTRQADGLGKHLLKDWRKHSGDKRNLLNRCIQYLAGKQISV